MSRTPWGVWYGTVENIDVELSQARDDLSELSARMREQGFDGDFDPRDQAREVIAELELIRDSLAKNEPAKTAEDEEFLAELEESEAWAGWDREDEKTREAESGYPSAHEPLHTED